MTYGWAILIMMVVIAILFYLGIFSPFSIATSDCAMPTGFSCYSFKVYSGGSLSLDIGQSTGRTILVNSVACDEGVAVHWVEVNRTIRNAMHGDIENVTCYNADGSTPQMGQSYHGNVYLNYTDLGTGYSHHVQGSVSYPVMDCGVNCPDGASCASNSNCAGGYCLDSICTTCTSNCPIGTSCTNRSMCASDFCDMIDRVCATNPPCPPRCGDGLCSGDENLCNCDADCDVGPCNCGVLPCTGLGGCDYHISSGCDPEKTMANSHEHCPAQCPLNCSGEVNPGH